MWTRLRSLLGRRPGARRPHVKTPRPQLEVLEERSLLSSVWQPLGPSPIRTPVELGYGTAVGAVEQIAVAPVTSAAGARPALLATANGGIWRTTNILTPPARIRWTPVTDQLPTLAIGAIAYSPVGGGRVVWAGTGEFSNGTGPAGPTAGLYLSTDGGLTWRQRGPVIADNIRRVVPTVNSHVILAAAANENGRGGLYRSGDAGFTFRRLGGVFARRAVTDLVADPVHPRVLYAAVAGSGVFRSPDLGLHWSRIDVAAGGAILGLADSGNVRLAVRPGSAGGTILYVGVADRDPRKADDIRLTGVFRGVLSARGVVTVGWHELADTPPIHEGAQGFKNFSITADPADPNLVYVGGDQAPNLFRGDAAVTQGDPWEQVAETRALGGTKPHDDSISLTFLGRDTLLETDDGGVYELPRVHRLPGGTRWVSLNGNLADTEFYSVGYDPLFRAAFGGTQDNGSVAELGAGNGVWQLLVGGDGNTTALGAAALPGQSLRYVLGNNFHVFFRVTVGPVTGAARGPGGAVALTAPGHGLPNGARVLVTGVGGVPGANGLLRITVLDADHFLLRGTQFSGRYTGGGFWAAYSPVLLRAPGSRKNFTGLSAADNKLSGPEGEFVRIPFALNATDPQRLLIGFHGLYESMASALGKPGDFITQLPVYPRGDFSALFYGGRRVVGGTLTDEPNVVIAGTTGTEKVNGELFYRGEQGSTFYEVALPGAGPVHALASDPQDWRRVYVLQGRQVLVTDDITAGSPQFKDLTPGLPDSALPGLRSLLLVPGGSGGSTLLAGGLGGVFRYVPQTATWVPLGADLPNAGVTDLRYDAANDLLVAATFGRGVWELTGVQGQLG